jgi:DNA repair protein SbcC/Rad50
MKILRLHFRNLHSLRGDTMLDFSASPLATTGLFAITGDTGAGKSTILDAMTLALYGRMPRAGMNNTPDEVLTHGENECFAELEFLTKNKKYRAKWSLRKVKTRKGDTNPVKIDREISEEVAFSTDFKILTAKVSEVSKEVERITSLDYERFTRSVLLAQGDFATFLKAKESERSELLERITGIEIYSELSKAAFEELKKEKETLDNLQRQKNSLSILTEQEEDALRADALAQQNASISLQTQRANIENILLKATALHSQQTENTANCTATQKEKLQLFAQKETVEATIVQTQTAINETNHWLSEQYHLENIVIDLPQIQHKIAILEKLLQEGKSIRKKLDAALLQKNTTNTALQQLRATLASAETQQKNVLQNLQMLLPNDQNAPDEALARLRQEIDNKKEQSYRVRESLSFHRQHNRLIQGVFEKADELEYLQIEQSELDVKLLSVVEVMDEFQKHLDYKQHAYEREKLMDELKSRRDTLREGEPCPLCGAMEHPYQHAELGALDTFKSHLKDAKKELDHAKRLFSIYQTDRQNIVHRHAQIQEKIRLMLGDADRKMQGQIDKDLAYLELSMAQLPHTEKENTLEKLVSLERMSDDLTQDIAALEKIRKNAETLIKKRDLIAQEIQHITQQLHQSELANQTFLVQITRFEEEREQKRVEYEDVLNDLNHILGKYKVVVVPKNIIVAIQQIEALKSDFLAQQQQLVAGKNALEKHLLTTQHIEKSIEDKIHKINILETQAQVIKQNIALLLTENQSNFSTDSDFFAALTAHKNQIEQDLQVAQQLLGSITSRLQFHEIQQKEARAIAKKSTMQQKEVARWSRLNELIGSADGKKFRVFAQALTLQRLLQAANHYLLRFSDRYRIEQTRSEALELEITDTYQADHRRSMYTLSGGETFLVSLALALGLSDMAGSNTRIQSLFIDEGFGTLDETTLDIAIATLENLQASGRVIGIISHIHSLKERIGTQIFVRKLGNGVSKVEVI